MSVPLVINLTLPIYCRVNHTKVMRTEINLVLDQVEELFKPNERLHDQKDFEETIDTLQLVQDAYVEIIQQALKALMNNKETLSHDLLHAKRKELVTTLERIANLIEAIGSTDPITASASEPATDNILLKMIIEYLFTRARLVDELKMFPEFGLDLLDRMSFDESLDETIHYMETVMTGKQNLYQKILSQFENTPKAANLR